ncbi:hypothetical protein CKM354_001115800 [Cercospora kikuchii]|uniref:Phosphoglycerate mutase-like protein n=1 Tax=Cercospora kikuchii TaxID=84275 RepID=A0A9P3CSE7_9PEZI|nr:uncharacterized protein CKM354_001115800 [Cercospora kikuchii]GIZ48083.1 hypothetical protein CKM354_001115800 [Cercospora kikuchii]
MTVTIHCIRHGQGVHNLMEDYTIHDPLLTPDGEARSRLAWKIHFPDEKQGKENLLIAASPSRRTLQTACLAFQDILDSTEKKVLAIPDAQETSDDACDTGSDPESLREFINERGLAVDLSLVGNGWNKKQAGSRYGPSDKAIIDRAIALRRFLFDLVRNRLPESAPIEIALVSHGTFLHYFTGDWEDACRFPATGWKNCEIRSYGLRTSHSLIGLDDVEMVELAESRRRRGLTTEAPNSMEQRRLKQYAMEYWGQQGLQRPDLVP